MSLHLVRLVLEGVAQSASAASEASSAIGSIGGASDGGRTITIGVGGSAFEEQAREVLIMKKAVYEKEFPHLVTFCVGTGPEEKLKIKGHCEKFELKSTYVLGARARTSSQRSTPSPTWATFPPPMSTLAWSLWSAWPARRQSAML